MRAENVSRNDSGMRRSLVSLAILNFFLADARDGLGPFLDAFLATRGWSSARDRTDHCGPGSMTP
ncbi:hypothetical protein [Mycolicibacterium bacteremicum]|uniref:Uncharacterized protein n=1 Tax=Mycolicibacterium bacteremicum TaxID=564198 RepID=A0A1W9YZP7_MYCBA|nr:hypothetical protein [Mycolicibacterium bacteremicum]MCV7435211.1 hypothetical protein [Mycolicibacterium bacteremicum]ORA05429.1 hypothetical protein BST17_09530 [Mycolicibacterium bacteremicum]